MVEISVIIPVYNVEDYLEECLESIVNQTFKDIEIICIDDGSTDNSADILEEYKSKDSRISVYSQQNKGPSAVRNKGIALSKGRYVYCIDSDDFIELNALEELYNIAEEKDTDFILFKLINFNQETKEEYNTYYYDMPYLKNRVGENIFNYEDIKEFVFDIPVSVPGKFFKRDFISQIQFPEEIKFEDNIFSLEALFRAKRLYFYDEYLYHRRIRSNSITKSFHIEYLDFIKMNDMLFEKIKELGHLDEFRDKLYHKKFYNVYEQCTFIQDEEYKKPYFDEVKKDFLSHKQEYESDDVFLTKIDERLRCIFYSGIESDTWKEFEYSVGLFDKQREINNLKRRISSLEKSNRELKNENDSLKSSKLNLRKIFRK